MQKVTISVCGEHTYAQPRISALLFPPAPAVSARLQRLALLNGYSARVTSRKALQPFERSTPTHHEKLVESLALTGKVVAAWGTLPGCLQGVTLCPPRTAKFRRYEP